MSVVVQLSGNMMRTFETKEQCDYFLRVRDLTAAMAAQIAAGMLSGRTTIPRLEDADRKKLADSATLVAFDLLERIDAIGMRDRDEDPAATLARLGKTSP